MATLTDTPHDIAKIKAIRERAQAQGWQPKIHMASLGECRCQPGDEYYDEATAEAEKYLNNLA
jgi:hypothetical protein